MPLDIIPIKEVNFEMKKSSKTLGQVSNELREDFSNNLRDHWEKIIRCKKCKVKMEIFDYMIHYDKCFP